MKHFSGTYRPELIQFLLNVVDIDMTPVEEKERLIQSGEMHYSDMLSKENAPSILQLKTFQKATDMGAKKMASETLYLAEKIKEDAQGKDIVLASLVRAGAPLGVCLVLALEYLGVSVKHYGISIVRDRGLDSVAMDFIETQCDKENIYFVDGWTGKGAISNQLRKTLSERGGYPEEPKLVVLADPCGKAWLSASNNDWLIPFGIMGSTISGLISRTVWSDKDNHGCVLYNDLKGFDLSQSFADKIASLFETAKSVSEQSVSKQDLRDDCDTMVRNLAEEYGIDSINRVKPGVAEATRAVMRRVPDYVLIKDMKDPDVALLIDMARKAGSNVIERGAALGKYKAVTLIKKS